MGRHREDHVRSGQYQGSSGSGSGLTTNSLTPCSRRKALRTCGVVRVPPVAELLVGLVVLQACGLRVEEQHSRSSSALAASRGRLESGGRVLGCAWSRARPISACRCCVCSISRSIGLLAVVPAGDQRSSQLPVPASSEQRAEHASSSGSALTLWAVALPVLAWLPSGSGSTCTSSTDRPCSTSWSVRCIGAPQSAQNATWSSGVLLTGRARVLTRAGPVPSRRCLGLRQGRRQARARPGR